MRESIGLVLLVVSLPLGAAEGAFVRPLHLTREVAEPVTGRTFVVEEYFYGNRAVAIQGEVVAIADYAKGELVRIDRAAGSWSVAEFDAIARASGELSPQPQRDVLKAGAGALVMHRAAEATIAGRAVEIHRGSAGDLEVEAAIDRSYPLTREAAEIILGVAYPSPPSEALRAIVAAAAPPAPEGGVAAMSAPQWGLPLETTVLFRAGSDEVRATSRVTRVGGELPPAELIAIPPGARQVEHPLLERARLLSSFDRLPAASPRLE